VSAFSQLAKIPPGSRVLFQGDSITDMNRGRTDDPNHILGHSYAFLIAARTGATYPERKLEFVNRGASGNKIADLAARWDADAIAIKPTILSILVGVNDVDFATPPDQFEQTYDALLSRTQAALPDCKIVLCEPFGLPTGWRKSRWPELQPRLVAIQAIVKKLAERRHATFVPLQSVFDEACKRGPADYWIWDSIHPTYSGQELIADQWAKIVNRKL
jgi:lysophospholipase L1-like esterase